ncbi:MAG: tol-pal system protein YbgF [Polyangiaceae bacterium]
MTKLHEDLTRVQADSDKFNQRLNALEVQASENLVERRPPGSSKPSTSASPTPNLRVVHLSPDGSEQAQASSETAGALNGEDTDDTTPRPSIKVAGSPQGRASRNGRNEGVSTHRGQDVIEETLPEESANGGATGPAIRTGAPRASALDPEAKKSYDSALSLVNGRQFGPALDAFSAFLVKWPDHPNADNATYWRGECYFAQGEFSRAAEQFEGTIVRFPLGNKVPDALLKLGMCQQKLGEPAKAKASFERLQREFPRSEASRRIPSGESK